MSPRTVSATALAPLPEVRAGDDLAALLMEAADGLRDGDAVVVAHKVVSKAEGRVRRLAEVVPEERARALAAEHDKDARIVQVVLDETAELVRAEASGSRGRSTTVSSPGALDASTPALAHTNP